MSSSGPSPSQTVVEPVLGVERPVDLPQMSLSPSPTTTSSDRASSRAENPYKLDPVAFSDCINQCFEKRCMQQPDDPGYVENLDMLAGGLFIRFNEAGDADDLDAAIVYSREALYIRLPGDSDRGQNLAFLARTLMTKFENEGDVNDQHEAFAYVQELKGLMRPQGGATGPDDWDTEAPIASGSRSVLY